MSVEHDQEIKVCAELAEDKNYIAFKAQESFLKEFHMGKWVAFVDGKLVATRKNEEKLFKYLDKHHPQRQAFVHHIVEVEEIIDIGGAGLQILDL